MGQERGEVMDREFDNINNIILYKLALNDLNLMDFVNILPSKYLRPENASMYATKKALRELRLEGLIQSVCESVYSDYDERNVIVRGYRITDKGRKTAVYRLAEKDELKIRQELFGQEMFPDLEVVYNAETDLR